VIVPRDCNVVYIDDLDNRELVTLIECISASGYHVPLMITFKGAFHLRKYFDNDLNGDVLWTRSLTGFVNNRITMRWLEHFDYFTKDRTKGAYRILIFDGYGSHDTDQFLDFCWQNRIRPFRLPAYSTHYTQPLDVAIFQDFKGRYKSKLQS
jgi:hypothetical protein